MDQTQCATNSRRKDVMNSTLNGIDYLEVYLSQSPVDNTFQALLVVFCLKPVTSLGDRATQNVIIKGGVRRVNPKVRWVYTYDKLDRTKPDLSKIDNDALDSVKQRIQDKDLGSVIVVRTDDGDFSNYTLRLVSSFNANVSLENFDERMSQIDFTYKIECEADFDCKQTVSCAPQVLEEPVIDYMAKDYASFRQILLDRLRFINPNWTESNPSDQGIMLVELLAHIADQISYYQDAVATQGYLGTASRRIAVRRHARLVDYKINDGSNAKAWIAITVEAGSGADGLAIRGKWNKNETPTRFFTGNPNGNAIVSSVDFKNNSSSEKTVFEAMYDITLQSSLNQLKFYTWSGAECYLPRGSTSATLINQDGNLYSNKLFCWSQFSDDDRRSLVDFLRTNFGWDWLREDLVSKRGSDRIQISTPTDPCDITLDHVFNVATLEYQDSSYKFKIQQDGSDLNAYSLSLYAEKVLVFKEIRAPSSPNVEGDRTHRQAVRLVSAIPRTDAVTGTQVVDIQWHQEDALTFPLCLYVGDDFENPVSVALANVVLADHGQTIENELLSDPMMSKRKKIPSTHRFYPKLSGTPLTRGSRFCDGPQQNGMFESAKSATEYKQTNVIPWIEIYGSDSSYWLSVYDLLDKSGDQQYFVAETEDDGSTYIRFGDGVFGAMTDTSQKYIAKYRVGNGTEGNVAAESINKIVLDGVTGISSVSNPLAAEGGTDPETLDEIRQYAPQAFRTQMRAVTMDDYVEILKRRSDIQNASASLVWTGSWYTVFVTVDRKGGLEVDDGFKNEITDYLLQYRLCGYDIEVMQPVYAALEIVLEICVAANYRQEDIERQLLKIFSKGILDDGSLGFFYPDSFSFGQPLYLSQVYDRAMQVEGINSIEVITFHRLGSLNPIELKNGVFRPAPFEIIIVDNDPNNPENGKISFVMSGGIR